MRPSINDCVQSRANCFHLERYYFLGWLSVSDLLLRYFSCYLLSRERCKHAHSTSIFTRRLLVVQVVWSEAIASISISLFLLFCILHILWIDILLDLNSLLLFLGKIDILIAVDYYPTLNLVCSLVILSFWYLLVSTIIYICSIKLDLRATCFRNGVSAIFGHSVLITEERYASLPATLKSFVMILRLRLIVVRWRLV